MSGHRKAALGYLGELIQGRVSLEMHNEETHRHQEAHKQMDHHLAAVSGQSLWVGAPELLVTNHPPPGPSLHVM